MQPVHPKGNKARILLSSVFGPYAQDDPYGSRKINPMELYQNQVTRVQGVFSLRMFHRSFGLLMIKENINAPCTLLDFPTEAKFIEEIISNSYDIVGISAIAVNIGKVARMCELVRHYLPQATIIVGGHIANVKGIDKLVDADIVVRGEGIRWFQRYLGQDDKAPIKHPMTLSAFGSRVMGIKLGGNPRRTAAILIPSVGCPVGCNFCSTSALFGGKGKFVNFYETGDELFEVMCQIERKLRVKSFFILDENFLLNRKRALRLLELMEAGEKSWSLYVFSSARVLKSYTIDQLVRLGIGWVWLGLEGAKSDYGKLKGVDTKELVATLQANGIRVLGSTIIGLEEHSPENIEEVINYAVGHETVFHQFMLYTPVPGTPLYENYQRAGLLFSDDEFPLADAHGQYRFNYRHPRIKNGEEEGYLLEAFQRDFRGNGPSLLRLIGVLLAGWKRYKDDPRKRIRRRIAWEVFPLRSSYAGAVWAMRKWFQDDERIAKKCDQLLKEIYNEFGAVTKAMAPIIGRYVYKSILKEKKRLELGWSYEPTFLRESNETALKKAASLPIFQKGFSVIPAAPLEEGAISLQSER